MSDGGKGDKQRPTNYNSWSSNYDNIFKKETSMQVRVKENVEEIGKCGCGRSPTGKCIGWHGLNETQLKEAQDKYQEQQQKQ